MSEQKTGASLDDYRGMNADDFKKTVTDKQTKQTQEPSAQTQQQAEPQQNQTKEPEKELTDKQEPQQSTKDADVDPKDVNVLANTFGIEYESLPEEQREGFAKMAKSYREAQGKYTSVTQEAQQTQQMLQQLNQFLEKNPDLKQEFQNRLSGNQPTGKDTPSKPEPASTGQSATVDEQQLKSNGYLKDEDLQGLDELAKERAKVKAELAYLRDQELSKFREGLISEKEKLTKAERVQQVKKTNIQRLNDGVDRVVSDYGIDFTTLDNETISAIQNRALRILDPQDPTGQTIDKDAMYDATLKELAIRGKLPQRQQQFQPKTLDGITDTGKQVNKRSGNIARPNTRENIYEQKMAERRANIKDSSGVFASN